jgi:hypothetical protein
LQRHGQVAANTYVESVAGQARPCLQAHTQFGSSDVAIRNAKAVAEFWRPTKSFQDAVTGMPPVLPILTLGAIAVEGGLPLFVSGAPLQDQRSCPWSAPLSRRLHSL